MVVGHLQNGEHEEALRLYARMDKEGITLTNLTTSIARRGYPSLVYGDGAA